MALRISRDQLNRILRHGETAYPHECCGLLLGQATATGDRDIREARPMRNANQASPQNRFDFDPQEHLVAQREARENGLNIVGFYHSHPDHPAQPSQFDLDHASWPGYSYLIVSINAGRAGDVNSFELADDRSRFDQESITVIAL
ncbi:MAG TPA: M67 family metallopeptidase [Terriglobales bacterium]|nr:M67 family metallopeptidase [Terriglobales bacterium]